MDSLLLAGTFGHSQVTGFVLLLACAESQSKSSCAISRRAASVIDPDSAG
jgi:hypothetical protein